MYFKEIKLIGKIFLWNIKTNDKEGCTSTGEKVIKLVIFQKIMHLYNREQLA